MSFVTQLFVCCQVDEEASGGGLLAYLDQRWRAHASGCSDERRRCTPDVASPGAPAVPLVSNTTVLVNASFFFSVPKRYLALE